MRFISESQSSAIISHEIAYAAVKASLEAVCEDSTVSFPVVLGHGSDVSNRFTVKAAACSNLAGLKVGSYWPGNHAKGLPRHNSTIFLFDQETGRINTAIEAGMVNAFRTAAADAVAADLLSRPGSETLAIFGTGNQARYECAAIARIRPIKRILVVGRDEANVTAMLQDLEDLCLTAVSCDAKAACDQADIIVTATSSRTPLFDADWVRSGTHVASMGSDATGKQELPPELFEKASLFCDLPEQSRRIGDFQHAKIGATITAIGDVIAGRVSGRKSTNEITVFDSSGLSVQDLFVANEILRAID